MNQTTTPIIQHRQRQSIGALLLANRLATLGLVIISLIMILALLAPWLPLDNPDQTDLVNRLLPAFSSGHLLGTDHLGRDILSRLLWGTRVSLIVGISAEFANILREAVFKFLAFHVYLPSYRGSFC